MIKGIITTIYNDDVKEMAARYADLKTQNDIISGEMKAIAELFKETSDSIIERNTPYLINHNGRSFSLKIERKSRSTTDSKAIANVLIKQGIDIELFKKSQEVQNLVVSENKLFA